MTGEDTFGRAGGVGLAEGIGLGPFEEVFTRAPDGVGDVVTGLIAPEEGEVDEAIETLEVAFAGTSLFFEVGAAAFGDGKLVHGDKHVHLLQKVGA